MRLLAAPAILAALVLPAKGLAAPYVVAGDVLQPGRSPLSGVATDLRLAVNGVTPAPGGSWLLSTGNRVVRLDAGGRLTVVAGGREAGNSGDGGPATSARLWGPGAAWLEPDGTLLIPSAKRLRRVGADGVITTIAGGGTVSLDEQGVAFADLPALSAQIWPRNVFQTADGRTFFDGGVFAGLMELRPDGVLHDVHPVSTSIDGCEGLDGPIIPDGDGILFVSNAALCRRDAGGVETPLVYYALAGPRVLRHVLEDASSIAPLPTGELLVTDGADPNEPSRLYRVRLDPPSAAPVEIPRDGVNLPFGFQFAAALPAPDGGLLVNGGTQLAYLPPRDPQLLALRFDPSRIRAARGRIAVQSTQAGDLQVTVNGKRAEKRIAAGRSSVSIPRQPPGLYAVNASLRTGAGGRTSAHTRLVLGGALSDFAARRALHLGGIPIANRASARDEYDIQYPDRCRRWSATRIDCRVINETEPTGEQYCLHLAAVTLGANGTLRKRPYRCGHFLREPRWSGRSAPVDMLGDRLP